MKENELRSTAQTLMTSANLAFDNGSTLFGAALFGLSVLVTHEADKAAMLAAESRVLVQGESIKFATLRPLTVRKYRTAKTKARKAKRIAR